jgi:hypothetical protein
MELKTLQIQKKEYFISMLLDLLELTILTCDTTVGYTILNNVNHRGGKKLIKAEYNNLLVKSNTWSP